MSNQVINLIPIVPVLFLLARISHNTGKIVEKIENHEKRLENIEKKLFFES